MDGQSSGPKARPSQARDIKAISVGGEPAARPILATRFAEYKIELLPDGRWLAYVSNETGRDEV